MEGERSGAGGGEPPVEDEFACAGVLRGPLASLHGTVERLFGVTFGLGADGGGSHGDGGQIWLKLRGPSGDVRAAKLFVKGLVNQEQQKEVSYPEVLHCIFCGARGLFVDGLTKNTSAHIVVDSAGFLLISGLEEPVVRAYSLITDLVERYEGAQSGHAGPGESLDSRRAFKDLVEKWEDKHFLDLLALPGSVKEVLLGLVRESGLGLSPARALADRKALRREDSEDVRTGKPFALPEPSRTSEGLPAGSGKDSAAGDSSFRCEFGDNRGRAEGAEGGAARSPPDVRAAPPQLNTKTKEEEEEERDLQMSSGNKEFWLLLKFFTAMGYTEDVVKRVLARTGPKEASQILDVVQQEQDRSDRQQAEESRDDRNRPCETEHREEEAMEVAGDESLEGAPGDGGHSGAKRGVAGERGDAPEEDFVLGVVKKAAASCGYMEQKVAKVYNMLPDGSTRQLLLELQREVSKEKEALREGPREMDDVSPDKVRSSGGRAREAELLIPAEESKLNDKRRADPQTPHRVAPAEVKGPPMPTYPPRRHPALDFIQTTNRHGQATPRLDASPPKHMDPTYDRDPHPKHKAPQVPQPHLSPRNDPPPSGARDRRGFTAASSVVVTGEQRFLEGLLTPFDLQLTDQTGDPNVRAIIIDGSNVAMSHGLGHFFSCRGIALAVQHFWDRGHRHISALVPQWRQKSNPKIKEQHYLTELQKLGLLAYTPSREVQGKMISSYDDRFMLQHAQKTDGVIVTNDNLRDLSDESPVWRDIIKKRLLQYTFVGDHFMVPDDPLGRGGPHLDDFLRSDHRTPEPGNHSFAGASTAFPSSEPARCSQTELLNLRDRVPGGGGNRGSRRGRGKGRDAGLLQGRLAERGPEETAALREQLCQVFPGQDHMVALVLQSHPAETDINVLSDLLLEQ